MTSDSIPKSKLFSQFWILCEKHIEEKQEAFIINLKPAAHVFFLNAEFRDDVQNAMEDLKKLNIFCTLNITETLLEILVDLSKYGMCTSKLC